MKYLLLEPATPSRAYNIALMKYARWCEENGHEYQYIRGMTEPDFEPDKILMSCIFTYYSKRIEKTIDFYLKKFPKVKILVGGVFPTLNADWFNKSKWNNPLFGVNSVSVFQGMDPNIEDMIPKWNVEVKDEDLFKTPESAEKAKTRKRNIVLYSSRGCVNKCGYCAVPKLEGDMKSFKSIKRFLDTAIRELPNANSIVLYDNNFTEHAYFFDICDELIESGKPVDIHGLHVDAFTEDMAKKFSEMRFASQGQEQSTPYLRFSFDKMKYRDNILRSLKLVKKYNVKAEFFCYMLYNWIDKPYDFWARIVYSQKMVSDIERDIYLFPQRYEPFAALEKGKYIGKHWTDTQLKGLKTIVSFLHNFIHVTKSRNIFNWFGYSYEEFLERIEEFGKNKEALYKKEGTPPDPNDLI